MSAGKTTADVNFVVSTGFLCRSEHYSYHSCVLSRRSAEAYVWFLKPYCYCFVHYLGLLEVTKMVYFYFIVLLKDKLIRKT